MCGISQYQKYSPPMMPTSDVHPLNAYTCDSVIIDDFVCLIITVFFVTNRNVMTIHK